MGGKSTGLFQPPEMRTPLYTVEHPEIRTLLYSGTPLFQHPEMRTSLYNIVELPIKTP